MIAATHDKEFHADDTFAVATMKMAGLVSRAIRTRDPAKLATADFRIDVGGKYNPDTGDYDHHQEGGGGVRENGIPYASFGLTWKSYGAKLCDCEKIAQ